MKRFLIHIGIFLLPLLIAISITEVFYNEDRADLLRVGYLKDTKGYRAQVISKSTVIPVKYQNISTLNLKKDHKFDILVIGDSFSDQHKYAYHNYLAYNTNMSVLYINRQLIKNPLEGLFSLLNGDVFNKMHFNYVILQSVERDIIKYSNSINYSDTILLSSLLQKKDNKNTKKRTSKSKLFSDKYIKFPIANLSYPFTDKPLFSQTYKTKSTSQLSTNQPNNLLFYHDDINCLVDNNDSTKIALLNNVLESINNKLTQNKTKLIVLPSPDKYSAYYQYIKDKSEYPEPKFFYNLKKLNRNYILIDSKKVIDDLIKSKKDIYFYDGTHWTGQTAEDIAKEIEYSITNHNK